MGLPITPDSERAAQLVPDIIRDLTTTRQKRLYPSGAMWINLSYRLLPGATPTANQAVKVVVNATSDADATGKLATDGSFIPLFQGDDLLPRWLWQVHSESVEEQPFVVDSLHVQPL